MPKGQSLIASQGKLVIKVKPQKGKDTAKSTSTTTTTSTATSTVTTTATATATAKGTKAPASAHVQQKKQPRKKVVAAKDSSSEVSGAEVQYDDDLDDSLRESSAESEGDVQLLPQEGLRWGKFYRDLKARDATTSGHFVSSFFRYLLHVEGGCHSEEQALIHTRQVNIILDTIDPTGSDLQCLIRNDGLEFWDKFCQPKLKNKELTGNTLKVYIRSLELFVTFILKNLFFKKDLLAEADWQAIISLNTRLPDYRSTLYR